jgi:hypothetical protein
MGPLTIEETAHHQVRTEHLTNTKPKAQLPVHKSTSQRCIHFKFHHHAASCFYWQQYHWLQRTVATQQATSEFIGQCQGAVFTESGTKSLRAATAPRVSHLVTGSYVISGMSFSVNSERKRWHKAVATETFLLFLLQRR